MLNVKFTMNFETKKERDGYRKMAEAQKKSLGQLVRELLAQWASQNSEGKAA